MMMSSLYNWQKDCLNLIEGKNAIVSAPTGAGKTKIAYLWANPKEAILDQLTKIIYTVPIKALANEKYLELIHLYGKENVGIETGDIKKNEKAPILICTQEIYTLKYALRRFPIKLIMDEFHYIFLDSGRSRAYIDGIRKANPLHRILIMSATLGNLQTIKNYLKRTTQKDFIIYHTDFRPTQLVFTDQGFTLETLPPHSLVYVFNINTIKRLAKQLAAVKPPLPVFKRRQIKKLAQHYRVNLENFPELFHGIAVYHSKMTYTQKIFIEKLAREKLIHTILSTNALGVGVNLPFEWIIWANLQKPDEIKRIKTITKIEFLQLSGRAGRKGYFDIGYVGYLEYEEERIRERYLELLEKPEEEPFIKLELDIPAILKNERTIEEEIEYVCKYSEPERNFYEVQQEALQIQQLFSSLFPLEKEFLQQFYFPELSLQENISLARYIFENSSIKTC